MKKPVIRAGGTSESEKASVGGLFSCRPLTWAMLTDDLWDDGSQRDRATILILIDGGQVKLWLNDKALDRSCWVSGESVEDAFDSLEGALYAGSAGWRTTNPQKSKKK